MNLPELKAEAIKIIKAKPDFSDEIHDLYYLAISEVEEGGSETHECELAYSDMLVLIKEA